MYVKFIRPQILPLEYDSPEAKVFLNWCGKPLPQGDLNKKVKNFFRRYGYDLSITRLREIIATHVEESANDLTNEGMNDHGFTPSH
jgi:site-specific recombinase XerC